MSPEILPLQVLVVRGELVYKPAYPELTGDFPYCIPVTDSAGGFSFYRCFATAADASSKTATHIKVSSLPDGSIEYPTL